MGKVVMSGIVPKLVEPSNFPAIGKALNDYTWEQIRAISDAGLASSYFSAGDIKTIIINGKVGATTFSNLAIDVYIIGINHNSAREGTNKIHFQIGKINGVSVALCDSYYGKNTSVSGAFTMSTNSYTNGWSSSHMRKTVLGSDSTPANPTANTLLAALPDDLLAVMKPVTKYTDNKGNGYNYSSNVTATTDYLPLLAEHEVGKTGSWILGNVTEQTYQAVYDYYRAGNSNKKYKHSATGTGCRWLLRSVYLGQTDNTYATPDTYCSINVPNDADGAVNTDYACGVSPLFAV